jgi:hypothetical protein
MQQAFNDILINLNNNNNNSNDDIKRKSFDLHEEQENSFLISSILKSNFFSGKLSILLNKS